jgi:cytochrome o ubiquinol oxidase subunit 3
LTETLILLTSSFTCTLSKLAAYRNDKNKVIAWFGVTFLLGVAFIAMELNEFSHWSMTAIAGKAAVFNRLSLRLSPPTDSHISTGLLWMIILIVPVFRHGLTPVSLKRLTCLRMFWHFLDIVWIFHLYHRLPDGGCV